MGVGHERNYYKNFNSRKALPGAVPGYSLLHTSLAYRALAGTVPGQVVIGAPREVRNFVRFGRVTVRLKADDLSFSKLYRTPDG